MPKIIENLREQLLAEARRQIEEHGYGRTTIRSVAAGCGIAIGTVYNYFPSKEMLVASYMAEDWEECLRVIRSADSSEAETYIRGIYDALTVFLKKHEALFTDTAAEKPFAAAFPVRHKQLRTQIAELILPVLKDFSDGQDPGFTAEFIAESLLTWTVAGIPFDQLYEPIRKLIQS